MPARAKTVASKPANIQDKLLEALGEVDRPGDICTSGDCPLVMPGLEVKGLGGVSLPLTKTQAKKLIKLCRQAPYGKGTETVVDTDVRRVWELDPAQFKLTNPMWDELVALIVDNVKQALGLGGRKLAAHLYKLLVYEEGSFFLPHRDGEKLDRMVATLVIGLPAVHEGGELIVSHEGRSHEIVFGGAASGHELSYAAFYADCQHEIRPVRSGYRLCLTYNLTLAASRGKQGIAAPAFGANAAAIGELLSEWSRNAQAGLFGNVVEAGSDKVGVGESSPFAGHKLAVTLEHRYTQDGLTIDALKGVDRARAEVLFEAAERADCVAHLALVTLWQSGSAEGDYDDHSYGYGHGRGYHWSDDEDDEDYDETASQYEMGEVFDSSLTADHWSDREGKKVLLGAIRLAENEIVAEEPLSESEPNREDFEGYTGNAGMTLERWYHRAAVIIWPRARHFHVLCGAGTDAAVGGLAAMVGRLKRASKAQREALQQECRAFAAAIIDSWTPGRPGYPWDKKNVDRNAFPAALCELNDPALVQRFLSETLPNDTTVQLDESFGRFCRQHGWEHCEKQLAAVINASSAATIARNAEMLRTLCALRDKNCERINVCARLCEQAAQAIVAFDNKPGEPDWRFREVDRAGLLGSLVAAMLAAGAEKPLGRLVDHVLTCGKYDLTAAQLAAVFGLEKQLAKLAKPNAAISKWLSACRGELQRRTHSAPPKPTDFRRAAELSCNCNDCRALARFLADPDQRQARFPLAKKRRQHLHQIIDHHRCDCTHVTERRDSPHALVCTKTTASYEAACKIHEQNLNDLARVVAIEKKLTMAR